MKRILVLAAVASSIAVFAACGGANESELFAAPGSSEFGTVPSGGDPSGSNGSTSGGGSSGLPGSSSSSSSSSSGGGSTSSSGGSSSGGSSGTTTDAGSPDAGPLTTGIWCGEDNDGDDVFCATGTACCVKKYGGGPSHTCSAGGAFGGCSNGGLPVRCDDQTDCPNGQVCCGTFSEATGYQSVQCATTCNSIGNTIRAVRFCDPKAANDECAAIGKQCDWSQGLPGYGICK